MRRSREKAPNRRIAVTLERETSGARTEFDVPTWTPMTVLDVLLAIQRDHDPSVGFRFSCRVGMCGTCGVRFNGRSVLACQTRVAEDSKPISIGPLKGYPVIRDLVIDTRPFWEQWQRVRPYVVASTDMTEPAQIPPDSAERQAIDPSLDCIQCGLCFSSCGISSSQSTFLGPAALNRALVLANDSRDTATSERLELVSGPDGVDRCHYIFGCSASCPKGLDPAGSIQRLRQGN